MNHRVAVRPLLAAVLTLAASAASWAAERNAWPFYVAEENGSGQIESQHVLGPIFEHRTDAGGGEMRAFRPLWLETDTGGARSDYLFYPFFTWQRDAAGSSFTFFRLINFSHDTVPAKRERRGFDLWPFYFSRDTGDPATSYHALFPIAGTIKERFGKDRLTWYAFPLYFNTDVGGKQVTSAPWPFIRVINGAGHHGFEFWPLYGWREHPGDYRTQFWLWPLGFKDETHLSAAQPEVKLGFLPFYSRDSGAGHFGESYVWPFFGYTHFTAPVKYDETRYFWPFLVQGRGDEAYVNRFGPIYTHSIIRGYDKTWLLWPLFRHARWTEDGITQEQNQFFYIVYSSLEQRHAARPSEAPAYKRHLWPLFSAWDNGAGRRQIQVLSPFEVFFPANQIVRQVYTPLFAIYRYEQSAPGDTRQSLLWNLVSWRRSPGEQEFHLGPFGWHRDPGEAHGRLFWFAFHPAIDHKASAASPP